MHEIMEFIWPMMAASAEGMVFFWIIVVLVIIGRGKILPSENAIVIDRQGQYKMCLAPGLNLSQPFIEAIAEQVTLREDANQDGLILSFEVRDRNIASRKQPFYLLQASLQNGYLSFDARHASQNPILPNTTSFECIAPTIMDDVENATHAAAKLLGIGLRKIS